MTGALWPRRDVVWLILLFWTLQFASLTIQRLLNDAMDTPSFLLPRLCVALVGVGLSFTILAGNRRLIGRPLRARLLAAMLFALVCCFIHGACNFLIFQIFMGKVAWETANFASFFSAVLTWFWTYIGMSAVLLALVYSSELNELQRVAHTAHMRALRYQLNPHFMFNTLNSIATLVSRKDPATAERMVENLSDFLRATLSLDPQEDIPLEREINLQSLYLEIETLRFSDRLQVEIDLPDEVRGALVPSLITQPLTENAIRHGVARSTHPILLRIAARRAGNRLRISVRNSAPDHKVQDGVGTGIGLTNVAERLRARFGSDCTFSAAPDSEGGYAVEIDMPFLTAREA
jgi:two-component system LytT family sensor kinase